MLPAMDALNVLHVDEALLVVDKPAGLLAVPGRGDGERHNLTVMLRAQFADVQVVHRLDQATSGLMLFARNAPAQRQLSMAFAARQVHKRYIAVVHGSVAGDAGTIDAPLMADWPNRPRQMVDVQRGKPALTRWRVLHRQPRTTQLELEPVTGRSHQLRVHLMSIGHPIVGDTLYAEGWPAHPRLLLHATQLHLLHPSTAAPLRFASAVPFLDAATVGGCIPPTFSIEEPRPCT